MPLPPLLARINKRVFNPRELKQGIRPVLTHVGRSSGKTYYTPLDAHPVSDGFIFIVNYGSKSDWVQNVLAAGTAVLTLDGSAIELVSPVLLSEDAARQLLPEATKRPPDFLKITEYLHMIAYEEAGADGEIASRPLDLQPG